MRDILACKFKIGTEPAELLERTLDYDLEEANTWRDRFWGTYRGEGCNWLGQLLMERRELNRRL